MPACTLVPQHSLPHCHRPCRVSSSASLSMTSTCLHADSMPGEQIAMNNAVDPTAS